MRIAILQPGYMPWLGFFEQMLLTDHFVYLDDVQYTKQDWRNRNRIKTSDGIAWLTVPVKKAPSDTPIRRIRICYDQPWPKRHLNLIQCAYAKAPHFDECYPRLEATLEAHHEYLHDLNAAVVDLFRDLLGITTSISCSSELGIQTQDKSEKLWRICSALGGDELYDGQAARSFLDVDGFERHGIKVAFQEYVHPTYPQRWGPFIPSLSALDLLMNCGPDAGEIILAKQTPYRRGADDRPSLSLAGKGIPAA